MFTGRLASRVSVALLKYSKPALLAHKYVPLSPNGLTRSFISTSWVAYAPEKTEEIKHQEDNQASENKPKKAKKTKDASASASEAKKPKKQGKPAQKSKLKSVVIITEDMLPPSPPLTAYSKFLKDWYSKRAKSSAPTDVGSQSKEVAAEWHALSESEKEPYFDSYRVEREVFEKKRQEWFDNIDPAALKELNKYRASKGKKQIRNPSPKPNDRPWTPFLLFASEYRRGQDEKLGVPEIGRRAGEAWRALSETEKQQYHDQYKTEMDAWRARNGKPPSA